MSYLCRDRRVVMAILHLLKKKRLVKLFVAIFAAYLALIFLLLYYSKNEEPCRHFKPQTSANASPGREEDDRRPSVSFYETDNPFKDQEEWKTFQKALSDYKAYHQAKLAEFKASEDGGNVRTLTWACSQSKCSGLGDQLFRIQYFLLLSMMSDRLFTIHWDKKLQKSAKYLLPNEIEWSYYDESKGMCDDSGMCGHEIYDATSLWGFGWTKDEFVHFGKVLFSSTQHVTVTGQVLAYNMYIGNLSMLDPGPMIHHGMDKMGVQKILSEMQAETVFCGHKPLWYTWLHRLGFHLLIEIPRISNGQIQANEPWLYFSHYTFTYLFKFSKDLVKRVEAYQRQLGFYNQDYLAVHLRTGFMGTPDQEKFVTRYIHSGWKFFYHDWEWDCILKHAIHLRDEVLGPDKPIYLSTDSSLVRTKVDTVYRNHHIVYGNLSLVHSRFNHKSCGSMAHDESAVEGHLAMWLDFFLLGSAKVLVHPDSSFSVNAAFLKPIPHKFHSWVLWDNNLGCLASYRSGNVACIDC